MRHHEVIVDFNRRGILQLIKRAFTRPQSTSQSQDAREYELSLREPSR